jgi:hypothetical protein
MPDPSSLRYRLRRRISTELTRPVLRRLAAGGRSKLAANLIRAQFITVSAHNPPGPPPHTVLALLKPGFTEDLRNSLFLDPRFRVIALDRAILNAISRAHLPQSIDDNTYRTAPPEFDAAKAALRDFWRSVWRHILAKVRIDAVATGNFGYHVEQEFTAALSEVGVPVIALHKENAKSPGLQNFNEILYRDRRIPFQGRLICTYNEIERNVQIRAGIAPPERISVTGMPRLDRIHHWRERYDGATRRTGERPKVVFFSFGGKTGAPYVSRATNPNGDFLAPQFSGLRFDSLASDCHSAMLEIARACPDIDVVIKSKGSRRSIKDLETALGGASGLPSNFEVLVGGDPFDLITSADALCGFNTTALLEGLAANVPVVVPAFAEAAEPANADFVLDIGPAGERATSTDALIRSLPGLARKHQRSGHQSQLEPAQERSLAALSGNSDGRAGQRVVVAVLAELDGAA